MSLLSLFQHTKVILGSVTVARTRLETEEEVVGRVKEALKFIPSERLILAPDCGLGMLPVDIIKQKLKIMLNVAKQF